MEDAPDSRRPAPTPLTAAGQRRPRVQLTLFHGNGRVVRTEAPTDVLPNATAAAVSSTRTQPPRAVALRAIDLEGRLRPALSRVEGPPPWATEASVLMPPGLRTMPDELDGVVDLPVPPGPENAVELAIALLRSAAQSERVSARGDAILVALEHAAQALADLFDPETAKAHLYAITARL